MYSNSESYNETGIANFLTGEKWYKQTSCSGNLKDFTMYCDIGTIISAVFGNNIIELGSIQRWHC